MYKKLIILFCLTSLPTAFAKSVHTPRPGDIALISLRCSICHLIESEEDSHYSHMGIVIEGKDGELRMAHALGEVFDESFESFFGRMRNDGHLKWIRHQDLLKTDVSGMTNAYLQRFKGKKYDPLFLWNNRDENGDELLYCSEFITKLLNLFLETPLNPRPMDFSKHYEQWKKVYAPQKVPQGELGNSPGWFDHSGLFETLEELKSGPVIEKE